MHAGTGAPEPEPVGEAWTRDPDDDPRPVVVNDAAPRPVAPAPAPAAPVPATVAPAPPAPAAAPLAAAMTVTRRTAGEPAGAVWRLARITVEADGWAPIVGQPRKETTALASTNRMAAPARSEPAVPNPAMYARVARTWVTYRHLLPRT